MAAYPAPWKSQDFAKFGKVFKGNCNVCGNSRIEGRTLDRVWISEYKFYILCDICKTKGSQPGYYCLDTQSDHYKKEHCLPKLPSFSSDLEAKSKMMAYIAQSLLEIKQAEEEEEDKEDETESLSSLPADPSG